MLGAEVIRVKLVAINGTVVGECVDSTKLGSGAGEFEKVLRNSKVPKDVQGLKSSLVSFCSQAALQVCASWLMHCDWHTAAILRLVQYIAGKGCICYCKILMASCFTGLCLAMVVHTLLLTHSSSIENSAMCCCQTKQLLL